MLNALIGGIAMYIASGSESDSVRKQVASGVTAICIVSALKGVFSGENE